MATRIPRRTQSGRLHASAGTQLQMGRVGREVEADAPDSNRVARGRARQRKLSLLLSSSRQQRHPPHSRMA